MFYLSDPFLLNPAGKKPDKKEGSQFPRLYKKFRSNFSEEESVCLPPRDLPHRQPVTLENRVQAEHGEVHFADFFPLKLEIAFSLPDTPGMIQRMKSNLLICVRPTPGQTEKIESKRMKSLRHVRLLCSTPTILRRRSKIVNIFHQITIL